MLQSIGSVENIPAFIADVKAVSSGVLVFSFVMLLW
jgi:hypothetical protein